MDLHFVPAQRPSFHAPDKHVVGPNGLTVPSESLAWHAPAVKKYVVLHILQNPLLEHFVQRVLSTLTLQPVGGGNTGVAIATHS